MIFNRKFFYCIFSCVFVNILYLVLLSSIRQSIESKLIIDFVLIPSIYELCFFYCLFFITALFPRGFGKILQTLLVVIMFIIALVDSFLLLCFNARLNSIFVEIFLSTNILEAKEFLSTYLDLKTLRVLGIFIFLSVLFWLNPFKYFKLNTSFILFAKLKKHSFKFTFAGFIIAIFLGISQIGFSYVNFMQSFSLTYWYDTIIQSIIFQKEYIAEYKKLKETYANNLNQSYKILSNTAPTAKIVLIIGESTQRSLMSLYNYSLDTTPRLKALQKQGNLFVFNDVVAPHTHTNFSLSKILTFSRYENISIPWYKQQNLIDIMNLSGYDTLWLSNQEAVSVYGNIPEIISQRAKKTQFSTINSSLNSSNFYDEILIKMLEEQDFKKDKTFIVLHLMGTHTAYKYRYPASFEKFTPKEILTLQPKLDFKQALIKAEYLNAIYYNDFVVSSIIKHFENDESLVIYLSDHADEVYDFRDFAGHNEAMLSKNMVEIPFMIYVSNKFKTKYPLITQRIENARNLPFMSDNFIHSFLDLIGIQTKDNLENASIFSPKYNALRARIIGGKDYDKDLKQNLNLVPSKLWLHRVDELAKFEAFKALYQGFEIDVHFFDDVPKPYFDVGHDGKKTSIALNLETMLKALVQNNKFLPHTLTLWLDFKNLSLQNQNKALEELLRLCKNYKINPHSIIVESNNYEALGKFKQAGFFTSYYMPNYTKEELENSPEKITKDLKNIVLSGNVSALSFSYYLYDFVKEAHLGYELNGVWEDLPLLTWNEGKSWEENAQEKAFADPQIKVILVGEKGNYR